ncbi:MAG: HupE/UreJ family protein [Sphingomonadales bacterium]|nr:HupE/UreJ family protein [Sphingomonadales bacterium]
MRLSLERPIVRAGICLLLTALASGQALAHGVAEGDKGFIETTSGPQIGPFLYLGAKHMVTGYDHLLFLFGVIFFLYRMKDVATYVTLFAIGHSTTLIAGVLIGTHVSPYLVDAIIGLSVVYKALDNLGAYRRWFGFQPNTKIAVLVFGLFHGLGLATKLQDFAMSGDGLVTNLIAFNVGVEIGQLLALTAILIAMGYWRRTASFARHAFAANVLLMTAGFVLFGMQMTGYFLEG